MGQLLSFWEKKKGHLDPFILRLVQNVIQTSGGETVRENSWHQNESAVGLHKKLTILIAFSAVLSLILFLTCKSINSFENTIVSQSQQHLLNIACTQAQSFERSILHIHGELARLARKPKLQELIAESKTDPPPGDQINCEDFAFECISPTADALYRLDANGIIQRRIPFLEDRIGRDYSSKPGVKHVMEKHESYISHVFNSTSGRKSVSVCCPVFKDDEFVGIVRATIFSKMLETMTDHLEKGQKHFAYVIDHDGIVVTSPFQEYVGKNVISLMEASFPEDDWSDMKEIVSQMRLGKEGVGIFNWAIRTEQGVERIKELTAFAPIRIGDEIWSVGVMMNYDEVASPVRTHTRDIILGAVFLVLAVIGVAVGVHKIDKRKVELRTHLKFSEKLKSLASELVLLEERERRVIAVDLHDNVAQLLALSKIKLQSLEASLESDDHKAELDEVCNIISTSIGQMETLMFDLSNVLLHEVGLVAAIDEWLEEKIVNDHGIKAQLEHNGNIKELDEDKCILLFRSVKELLMNVVKHADAKNVLVSIRQVDGQTHVSVEDDGIGFEVSHASEVSAGIAKGFGLFSIRDRMEQFGGHIDIDSQRNMGTRVTLVLPTVTEMTENK